MLPFKLKATMLFEKVLAYHANTDGNVRLLINTSSLNLSLSVESQVEIPTDVVPENPNSLRPTE